jgi:GntP family gluconate:H+ symporter
MTSSFIYILAWLLAGIAVIVLLTTKYRLHAFFALLISCFIVGLGVQLPLFEVISTIKDGFGNVLKSLGLIIVLGTTLGILLQHTGSTEVMASYIIKKVGEGRSALSMSLTGFIVGLPLFCDSGFIVLSGLNNSLARRTGTPIMFMAVSLATGLYSVHCLIPPHPGAAAAAGIIGVDAGKLILAGIVVAIPAAIIGYSWARFAGKDTKVIAEEDDIPVAKKTTRPSVINAFLPVLVPIVLIALRSFLLMDKAPPNMWEQIFISLGDPVLALSAGVILAFNCKRDWDKQTVSILFHDAVEKAGGILMIIGAGGAFGAILSATKMGEQLSAVLPLATMGILFPFLLTFLLKTAQGSSTVAIITAASITLPLLPALGLNDENGRLICVLSMGAGSMFISHANDAYFWVISRFTGLDMKPMLRVYSVATIWMALVSLLMVYLLSLFIS